MLPIYKHNTKLADTMANVFNQLFKYAKCHIHIRQILVTVIM